MYHMEISDYDDNNNNKVLNISFESKIIASGMCPFERPECGTDWSPMLVIIFAPPPHQLPIAVE